MIIWLQVTRSVLLVELHKFQDACMVYTVLVLLRWLFLCGTMVATLLLKKLSHQLFILSGYKQHFRNQDFTAKWFFLSVLCWFCHCLAPCRRLVAIYWFSGEEWTWSLLGVDSPIPSTDPIPVCFYIYLRHGFFHIACNVAQNNMNFELGDVPLFRHLLSFFDYWHFNLWPTKLVCLQHRILKVKCWWWNCQTTHMLHVSSFSLL